MKYGDAARRRSRVVGGSQYSIAPNGDGQSHDPASVEILTPATGSGSWLQLMPRALRPRGGPVCRRPALVRRHVRRRSLNGQLSLRPRFDPAPVRGTRSMVLRGDTAARSAAGRPYPDRRPDHDANPTARCCLRSEDLDLAARPSGLGPVLFPSVTVLLTGRCRRGRDASDGRAVVADGRPWRHRPGTGGSEPGSWRRRLRSKWRCAWTMAALLVSMGTATCLI